VTRDLRDVTTLPTGRRRVVACGGPPRDLVPATPRRPRPALRLGALPAGWNEADLRRWVQAHRAAGDALRIVRDPEPCPPRLIPL